jgi:hypothetical protein
MNVCADKNRCAWPRSHRGDRFERFRTSKQTGRNPPKADIQAVMQLMLPNRQERSTGQILAHDNVRCRH